MVVVVSRNPMGNESVEFFPGNPTPQISSIAQETLLFVGQVVEGDWQRIFEIRLVKDPNNTDPAMTTSDMQKKVWNVLDGILRSPRLQEYVPDVYPTARERGLRLY